MDDIQIGEYFRTKHGTIMKFEKMDEDNEGFIHFGELGNDIVFCDKEELDHFLKNEIIKHDFNLINLIEKGDYVNGDRVVNVINEEPCPSGKCVDIDSAKQSVDCTLWEEDIKTIVTHEQMKAMEYEVGGEDE